MASLWLAAPGAPKQEAVVFWPGETDVLLQEFYIRTIIYLMHVAKSNRFRWKFLLANN
jgi:hypothetical protein